MELKMLITELKELLHMPLDDFYMNIYPNQEEYEYKVFCDNEDNNIDTHVEFEKENEYSLRKKEDNGFIRFL